MGNESFTLFRKQLIQIFLPMFLAIEMFKLLPAQWPVASNDPNAPSSY